jgi:hypothetical protein
MATGGLIRDGIASPRDVDLVTAAYRTEGVMQDGKLTPLLWSREDGQRTAKVTTLLRADQQHEVIGLFQAAVADRSGSLLADKMEAAIQRSPRLREAPGMVARVVSGQTKIQDLQALLPWNWKALQSTPDTHLAACVSSGAVHLRAGVVITMMLAVHAQGRS